MKKELICIVCPQGCRLTVEEKDGSYQVSGNTCKRGEAYGINEITAPRRVITTTVKLEGGRCPRLPVKMGDVVLADVMGTGVDVIATRDM